MATIHTAGWIDHRIPVGSAGGLLNFFCLAKFGKVYGKKVTSSGLFKPILEFNQFSPVVSVIVPPTKGFHLGAGAV